MNRVPRVRPAPRRIRVRWGRVAVLVAGLTTIAVVLGYLSLTTSSSAAPATTAPTSPPGSDPPLPQRSTPSSGVWPDQGQAAYALAGGARIHAGPNQHVAPIASVAKVMTAYVVLRDHPLRVGEDGPAITLTNDDVVDTDRRRSQDESIVPIAAGERLSERQALQALLLPSANNIAAVLARWDAGSETAFVARMNAAARSLGMAHTRYTDPSGYDPGTVSTAADQVRIVVQAMRSAVFAGIVAMPSVTLPVAGTVRNVDTLIGHDGFVGVKTGSMDASGGCFAFRAIRSIDGERTAVTGVVLGQFGGNLVGAALAAADSMVDGIAGS